MGVSTKRPLTEEERKVLRDSFRARGIDMEPNYRTTHLIWSTACHPWSLSNWTATNWRVFEQNGRQMLSYVRAKTHEETHLDLDPHIAGWWQQFLEEQGGHTEREYHRRVKTFGGSIGLEGLSPRALRHDRIFLDGRASGWDLPFLQNRYGTDAKTLLRYMQIERATQHSEAILKEAFL